MALKQLRWGVLGPGKIAHKFIEGLRASSTGVFQAAGSRSRQRAEDFVRQYEGVSAHGSYETLLADEAVDAVYIATPHPLHAQWAIRAAKAGKHVLCEKPLGMNLGEVDAIQDAGVANRVFIMEAFMYRCYPQTGIWSRWIREGKVGTPQLIEATFAFRTSLDPESRLFANALGGGGIMDVGCYPISAARLIAGAREGMPFLNPIKVCGAGVLGETGVDETAVATLQFPNGLLAQCTTGVRLRGNNQIRVTGTEGVLLVESPWFGNGVSRIIDGQGKEVERYESEDDGYQQEIDTFAYRLAESRGEDTGEYPEPASTWMSPEDSFGNMKTLDQWRRALGLVYDFEKPGPKTLTPVDRRELQLGSAPISRTSLPGFSKPLSVLAMGVDNQPDLPYMRTILDDFISKGGNVLDTAFIYGAGRQEELVGGYLASRPGLREDLFIIGKGCHTPYCFPGVIGAQLEISLERMGIDSVDLYLLHRDNPEVPVEEFVQALQAEQKAGRILKYGVSNWTLDRIQSFNRAAESLGADPIAAVSNNLSLADMVEPVWAGCLSAKDPAMAEWLESTQTVLFPWSSQARGFFTDRSGPDKREDEELVRAWYSEENFERKRRAERLADHYQVRPINIALAWLYTRPYPICPLVGPRRLAELRTLLPGVDLDLGPGEAAWLNLESDQNPHSG